MTARYHAIYYFDSPCVARLIQNLLTLPFFSNLNQRRLCGGTLNTASLQMPRSYRVLPATNPVILWVPMMREYTSNYYIYF